MDDSTSSRDAALPPREVFVWVYVVALAVLAAGRLGAGHPRRPPRTPTPHLPWWAIALGFAVAEPCVVHLRFRRSAHSFSLADLPFVFGLVFATGDEFVLGALVGTGIVYGLSAACRSSSSLQPRPARARRVRRRRDPAASSPATPTRCSPRPGSASTPRRSPAAR